IRGGLGAGRERPKPRAPYWSFSKASGAVPDVGSCKEARMAQPTIVGDKLNGGAHKVTRESRANQPARRPTATKTGAHGQPASAPARAAGKKGARGRGVPFERHFSQRGTDPLDAVTWERRSSVITNP